MKHTMKQLAGATLVAAMSLAGSAYGQQADDVKIGYAGPMTGAQAHYGKDMQNGIALAIEDVNATKPTIGGKPVRFVLDTADDQADPRTGTTVAQKLVDDGIKGMLGHFNSGTTIPASRIYANAGIPQIAMATAPEYTQQGFKTTFRMMTSDTQQGAVAGSFAVKNLGMKKIAIIDDRTAYGQGLADQFEKAAKAAGGKIVDREFTNDKAVDFKSILTRLKAANPSTTAARIRKRRRWSSK
jgi:branched-chain amino acid transport system substrate-binding protein